MKRSNTGEQSGKGEMMTVAQVADYFCVDSTTVRRWVKEKRIDAVPLPRLAGSKRSGGYRIRRVDFEELIARSTLTSE